MPGALSFLRESIRQHTAALMFSSAFDPKQLDQEISKLTQRFAQGPARPAADLVQRAVTDFIKSPVLDNYRQARLVSFGFTNTYGPELYRLIEDSDRFPRMLDGMDGFKPQPRAYRRCYKGLLNGYFSYDPAANDSRLSGQSNWSLLKEYLRAGIRFCLVPGISPDWVSAIEEHSNLLKEDPCARYAKSMLDGSNVEFEVIKAKIEISDSSWLTTQVVMSQVKEAVAHGDAGFFKYIAPLLDLLEKYPRLINAGLPEILNRYGRTQVPALHGELRDFSVACWGNPVLSNNNINWSLVAENTRDMVANWLKLYLIHQFFSLLAQDGQNDTRRLKFWQRYYKHIEGIHFALGNTAYYSHRTDFRRIRDEAKGHILGLHTAGSPDNNAFIMTFRNHVVVEFGLSGNACFAFKRGSLPFSLTGSLAGDSSELKSERGRVSRLLHHDAGNETWERRFESALAPILGCRPGRIDELPIGVGVQTGRHIVRIPQERTGPRPPDIPQFVPSDAPTVVTPQPPMQRLTEAPSNPDVMVGGRPLVVPQFLAPTAAPHASPHSAPQRPASPSAPTSTAASAHLPRSTAVASIAEQRGNANAPHQEDVEQWCEKHGFPLADLRMKGGNLWIDAGTSDIEANKWLQSRGFKFKDGKGWWRKW